MNLLNDLLSTINFDVNTVNMNLILMVTLLFVIFLIFVKVLKLGLKLIVFGVFVYICFVVLNIYGFIDLSYLK